MSDKLVRQRSSVKSKLTLHTKFLDRSDDSIDLASLEVRYESVKLLLNEYEHIQDQLESTTDTLDEEERNNFLDGYYCTLGRYKAAISKFNEKIVCSGTPSNSNVSVTSQSSISIRLPEVQLPQFMGKQELWPTFRDSFIALVDNNEKLSDIQKFHYLRSSIKNEAAKVIDGLKPTAANYPVAWALLIERYNDEAGIVRSHIKAIYDMPPSKKFDYDSLQSLLDTTTTHYRALIELETTAKYWDKLLVFLITIKLDQISAREWDMYLLNNKITSETIDDLLTFLKTRCKTLSKTNVERLQFSQKYTSSSKSFVVTSERGKCVVCSNDHNIVECPEFLTVSEQKRQSLVRDKKLCINCLANSHFIAKCYSKRRCRVCQKKHHTLLHKSSTPISESQESQKNSCSNSSEESACVSTCLHSCSTEILLPTAEIEIIGPTGKRTIARALLDSGSQSNFVKQEICSLLDITFQKVNQPVSGINSTSTTINKIANVSFHSRNSSYQQTIKCLVVPTITNYLPGARINKTVLQIPPNIKLADTKFNQPRAIDILIGAQLFNSLLLDGRIKVQDSTLFLQNCVLGWILSGPVSFVESNGTNSVVSCNLSLENSLERFWEAEELPVSVETDIDNVCEKLFVDTTTRDVDGRFIVSIPLKENAEMLGNTFYRATNRFFSLERTLEKDLVRKTQYIEFMRDYIREGHMIETKLDFSIRQNFIPHHCVINESSVTTKLRVVFDASMKSSSGISFNDVQHIGSKLQPDIFDILLGFRMYVYVLTADIQKMYRQISLTEEHFKYHCILWRENPTDELKVYQCTTVTYGTASAPYLAQRCLQEISNLQEDIKLKYILAHKFYMDDVLTGADTLEELIEIKEQLERILLSYGMVMHKWASNSKDVVNENITKGFICNKSTKTLGIIWNSQTDTLSFKKVEEIDIFTKRSILATISKVFDPLGLIGPFVVTAKLLMQKLWQNKIDWDETISGDILVRWIEIQNQLKILETLEIPRKVLVKNYVEPELHGFCDASEKAFACAIFIRSTNDRENYQSHLICAKSRIAPLRKVTIPRLELCGALLLARLMRSVTSALKLDTSKVWYWCDSSIVLAWINGEPTRWKSYVSHRTSEIRNLTTIGQWRYINTKQNPADIISRGCNLEKLRSNYLWWHGPLFLSLPECKWEKQEFSLEVNLPEEKSKQIAVHVVVDTCHLIDRIGSFSKLIRVTAYCRRFVRNCLNTTMQSKGSLELEDLDNATNCLIKICQQDNFSEELKLIKNSKSLPVHSKLLGLKPFIDKDGILRVGGRLEQANISFQQKHPIILGSKHSFTRKLILHYHYKQLHAGPQLLLSTIRMKYWPISGRKTIRSVLRSCIVCFRTNPSRSYIEMGNLPLARINPARPFSNCGTDFLGPLNTVEHRTRGKQIVHKAYVCVFVCFVTKAVHFEPVFDLRTDTFMASLKRFIARRGKPNTINSDNAKTFVGADRELKLFLDKYQIEWKNYLASEGISWKYIPPRTPHYGGIWESAVKSFKTHFRKVTLNVTLTFEELCTLTAQIEACLNSRPLVPLSENPEDLDMLTPGHFLIGAPLVAAPEPNYQEIRESHLIRFEKVQKMMQVMWSRWSKEYLCQLQERTKWKKS